MNIARLAFPAMLLLAAVVSAEDNGFAGASGREIIDAVVERHHQYPFVYEEMSMVLTDRHGNRQTRQMRSYMRVEADGSVKFMLLFDTPAEVEGVALLAFRGADGEISNHFYLPAHGAGLLEATGASNGESFLGTDFSVENLTGESRDDHVYLRQRDQRINGIQHYVIDVHSRGRAVDPDRPKMRHYVVAETLFITRTDYLDQFGRLQKRQSFHDIRPVGGGVHRANSIRMEDVRSRHQSLLRIDRRVFSRDYVPEEVFTVDWLKRNKRPLIANTLEGEE